MAKKTDPKSPATVPGIPGLIPIASGNGESHQSNGSPKRGKREIAAAARRALEAAAPARGSSVAELVAKLPPPETMAEDRAIGEEVGNDAHGLAEGAPTAPEAAPGKRGGRKPKPAPEAAPTGSQEPTAAPSTALVPTAPGGPGADAPLVVGERPLTDEARRRRDTILVEVKDSFGRVEDEVLFIGSRLREARDDELYRETHPTFAAFVEYHFDISYRQAHYIIGSADAIENLKAGGVESLPKSINAARQLISIPPEHQVEVWTAAAEIAAAEGAPAVSERHAATAARASGHQREDARRGRGRPPGSKNRPRTDDGPAARGGAPGGRGADPVERARAEGTIPANATVVITETEGEPVGNSEPLTDDDWLDTFEIRDKLTVHTRRIFDVSALGYRAVEAARVAFSRDHVAPAIARAEKVIKDAGPYLAMLAWSLRLPHPKQWRLCDSCKGTGELAKSKGQCPDCDRSGFHI